MRFLSYGFFHESILPIGPRSSSQNIFEFFFVFAKLVAFGGKCTYYPYFRFRSCDEAFNTFHTFLGWGGGRIGLEIFGGQSQ